MNNGGGQVPLLPQELLDTLPPLYSSENIKDPLVVARYVHLTACWAWYVIEGGLEDVEDDSGSEEVYLFFGFVDGLEAELDYFTLSQLEEIPLIVRDQDFKPAPLSVIQERVLERSAF